MYQSHSTIASSSNFLIITFPPIVFRVLHQLVHPSPQPGSLPCSLWWMSQPWCCHHTSGAVSTSLTTSDGSSLLRTEQDPVGLLGTKTFLGFLPWVPKGRFKSPAKGRCQSQKGTDAETREEQSRNNNVALGQGPGYPRDVHNIIEVFCRTKTPTKWKMLQREGHSSVTTMFTWNHQNIVNALLLFSCYCLVSKSSLTLCDCVDYSLQGSSVRGVIQARILQWVAISFSRRSSWPRGWICIFCTGRRILYRWVSWKALTGCTPIPKEKLKNKTNKQTKILQNQNHCRPCDCSH